MERRPPIGLIMGWVRLESRAGSGPIRSKETETDRDQVTLSTLENKSQRPFGALGSSFLVPQCDGVSLTRTLSANFFTAVPRPHTPFEQSYGDRKLQLRRSRGGTASPVCRRRIVKSRSGSNPMKSVIPYRYCRVAIRRCQGRRSHLRRGMPSK